MASTTTTIAIGSSIGAFVAGYIAFAGIYAYKHSQPECSQ